MAMRQRPPTFRAQPSLRAVYEDFQPKSEMTENPDAHILQIRLPGFTRDRVRITYVNSTRMVKVTGERPIESSNRWSRFNQSYSVPENCEVEKIQGKFDQGILTITMPKKFIPQIPQLEAETSQEKLPSPSKQTLSEPKPGKEEVEEVSPPKSTTTRDEDSRDKKIGSSIPSPVKGPQKVQEETEPKPFLKPVSKRQTDDKKAQKVQEEFEPKPTLKPAPGKKTDEMIEDGVDEIRKKMASSVPRKQTDDEKDKRVSALPRKDSDEMIQKGLEQMRQKITATTLPRKQQEEDDSKNIERFMHREGDKTSEPRMPKQDVKESIIKENDSKEKSQLGKTKAAEVSSTPKTLEKEKEKSKKAGIGEKSKKKDDVVGTIGKGMKEMADSASQAVTKISEGTLKEEERRSLLNMGAAAMVIAALGAYITYRFTTSGKP